MEPVREMVTPGVSRKESIRNPVDQFILARLEQEGLQPSPEADRRTLIRRLTFDLHGLPPTPDEVEAFVSDTAPRAYERLVDRLLDSPRYGERWARHWLDIAHYADTHGFERDKLRENAWRYRDYVIRSLNADKPYDQFLLEQIAGDVLDPNDSEKVIATGFLAAGPWDFVGQRETKSPELRRAARADDLDDMVTQVMTSTMAMTVNCARCHDHKLDPIPTRDYYRLWSVFAGVRREDRPVSEALEVQRRQRMAELRREQAEVEAKLSALESGGVLLAGIVAGGDGRNQEGEGRAIDVRSGKLVKGHVAYVREVVANRFQAVSDSRYIDGVVVPDGGEGLTATIPITSTGITVTDVPDTSGQTWDHVQPGPVQSQDFTGIREVDYASEGHSLIGLHANKAITFDLQAIREVHGQGIARFETMVGYGGKSESARADVHVFIDGQLRARRLGFNHADGGYPVAFDIAEGERFLTLMATDAGNGIGYDQVFFGDPVLRIERSGAENQKDDREKQRTRLRQRHKELQEAMEAVPPVRQVYAVASEEPEAIHVLYRGNPEDPRDAVTPGGLSSVAGLEHDFGGASMPEGQRRLALARWIVDPANPLTSRVLVNRLWHYHFGRGLVNTPSDFGGGGSTPTHPDLLDWLANEFQRQGWSLKAMHRLMLTSATYRQSSQANGNPAAARDSDNRLLWRQNPRRLDAEVVRDTVLSVTGKLNPEMYGPGYRDFKYTEAYAPIYEYVTPDSPEMWRRSIYRFVVRTTPHDFMTALDCPNPATLTPKRLTTTTALQSLALLNNDFMLKQSGYFAERLVKDVPAAGGKRVQRAFALVFGREAEPVEVEASLKLVREHDWFYFCRMLLNANEFIYLD